MMVLHPIMEEVSLIAISGSKPFGLFHVGIYEDTYSIGNPNCRYQLIEKIHTAFDDVKNNMENYNWEREF